MSEENNKEQKPKLDVYDMLIKQQHLILKQTEQLSKEIDSRQEKEAEVDIRRLVPNFLRKKNEDDNKLEISSITDNPSANDKNQNTFSFSSILKQYLIGLHRFSIAIVITTALGLAYGGYIFFTAEKVYQSTMLINPGSLEKEFYASLLNGLDLVAQNQNKSEIVRKLGISEEKAFHLDRFIYDEYDEYSEVIEVATDSTDQIIRYPFFTISINVTDNSILPEVEKRLTTYLTDNAYSKDKTKVKAAVLTEKIKQFDGQLNLLDSLKQSMIDRIAQKNIRDNSYFVKETDLPSDGIILSQSEKLDINPLSIFDQSEVFYKERALLVEELENLNTGFLIIDGFSAVDRPIFPRFRLILQYGIIGFVASSLITLLLAYFFIRKAD